MTDVTLLLDLGLIVVGAASSLLVGRAAGLPSIVSYIVAGLVLGPAVGLLGVSPSVELFSEIGIALLLFLVGLELRFEKVREVGGAAVLVGLVQVAVTLGAGHLLAGALGFGRAEALFLGLATAFSSTVVAVKLLDRAGTLGSTYGRITIGVLLVQDVLVAVALTLVSGLGGAGAEGGSSVAWDLLRAFGGIGLLLLGAAVAARWLLPRALAWLSRSREAVFVVALAWCFGFILAAELLHVSVELGAFVAGVALAQLPGAEDLRSRVHPLADFFVAVFFVALGAGLDPAGALERWGSVLLLSAFILLVKPSLVAFLVRRAGHSGRDALLSGVTLGQASEFAFVLTALAVERGLIGPELLPLVGGIGLVTIAGSALAAPRADGLRRALARLGVGDAGDEGEAASPEPSGHVVVVGMNTLGRRVARAFAERGEWVVAVDTDGAKLEGLPGRAVVGDVSVPATLEAAEVSRAKLVVSALQIEDVNGLLAYRCRRLGVPVAVHAFDPGQIHDLEDLGVDHLMVSKHEAAREMAAALRAVGVLG